MCKYQTKNIKLWVNIKGINLESARLAYINNWYRGRLDPFKNTDEKPLKIIFAQIDKSIKLSNLNHEGYSLKYINEYYGDNFLTYCFNINIKKTIEFENDNAYKNFLKNISTNFAWLFAIINGHEVTKKQIDATGIDESDVHYYNDGFEVNCNNGYDDIDYITYNVSLRAN